MPHIVQLNFTLTIAGAEYEQAVRPLAEDFAATPGLRWKIWLLNEAEREAGGIYLFDDEAAAQQFLGGPLAAQVVAAPFHTGLRVRQFAVMEGLTETTRGPVAALAARS